MDFTMSKEVSPVYKPKTRPWANGFTCGTFDLLHAGHVTMLKECAMTCGVLTVGLQTDPSIDRASKNRPVQSVYERWTQLQACKWVDRIIPYDTDEDLLNLIATQPIDVRFIGDEYCNKDFTGKILCGKIGIDICYNLPRYHSYSSSELRTRTHHEELRAR